MTEPKRDSWGRYVLPHPVTGEERHWTRVTTLAEVLEDQYNITKWKMRNVATGIGLRPDLLALAQALPPEDKQGLNRVADQALDAAQASARSNLGTALHKMTERLDSGEKFPVPAAHQADIAAYQTLKRTARIETRPDYIERITVVPELGVAGTMDRIVRRDGVIYIGDLKTGTDLKYGWGKIAIQLAVYAHGCGLWNQETETYEPMPPVDQQRGIVIHVPAGEGRAAAEWVDLEAGWEAAQTCRWVRDDWRKRSNLHSPVEDGA